MNLLLADASSWIMPGILLVLVAILFVIYFLRNKRYQQNSDMMVNNLKKGDKVKTYSGVYGVIVEIVENEDGKIVTIETGTDKKKSYVSYDIRAVYAINEPPKVEEPVAEETKAEEVVAAEAETESKVEEVPAEEVKEEVVAETEQKPARKPRKKKSE